MIEAERIARHYFPSAAGVDTYECAYCEETYKCAEDAEDCCAYDYACDFCGEIYTPVPGFSRGDIERAAINCCSFECSACMEVYHASKGSELTPTAAAAAAAAEDCCPHGASLPAFQ